MKETGRSFCKPVLFSCLVLFISFVTQALSMGFFVSFGTIYVELMKIFHTTETQTAWVGSIAISVCFLFGFFSSLMCKKYGCGNIISIGGALLGIGLLLSSVVENIFMLAVTFGGVTSIGCSFLYFASLSVLPHYFKKYLCLATSFACCGISLSGVTFSPMIAYLIKMYGFQTCFQLFSITAVLPLLGGFIIQRYGTDFNYGDKVIKTKVKILDQSIFRNKKLLLVIFVMSLVELCYFTPYVHLVNFAMHNGITLMDASFLPVSLSIGSLIGKIIFGLIGQIKGVNILYLFQFFLLAMGVCLTLLPMATSMSHMIIFSVVYGLFDGAFTGYTVPIVATTVSPEKLSMAFGVMYTFLSVEILFGPPLAGFIYATTSSYQIPFALCGGIIVLATLLLFFIPYVKGEEEISEKEKELLLQSMEYENMRGKNKKHFSVTKASEKLFKYGSKLKILATGDTEVKIFHEIVNKSDPCYVYSSQDINYTINRTKKLEECIIIDSNSNVEEIPIGTLDRSIGIDNSRDLKHVVYSGATRSNILEGKNEFQVNVETYKYGTQRKSDTQNNSEKTILNNTTSMEDNKTLIGNSDPNSKGNSTSNCNDQRSLKQNLSYKKHSVVEIKSTPQINCHTRIIDTHILQCECSSTDSSSYGDQIENINDGVPCRERKKSAILRYLYAILEHYSLYLSQQTQLEMPKTVNQNTQLHMQSVC